MIADKTNLLVRGHPVIADKYQFIGSGSSIRVPTPRREGWYVWWGISADAFSLRIDGGGRKGGVRADARVRNLFFNIHQRYLHLMNLIF